MMLGKCLLGCVLLGGDTGNFGAPGLREPRASVLGFLSEKVIVSDFQFKARNRYKYKMVFFFLISWEGYIVKNRQANQLSKSRKQFPKLLTKPFSS